MTRIGIHAPYARQEATHLALRLTDTMYDSRDSHRAVDWLSSQAHEPILHPVWDDAVMDGRKCGFKAWARQHRCGHIVWTDVQPDKVELAKRQGARNTLIAMWHRLSQLDVVHLGLFDAIYCPSKACHRYLQSRLPALGGPKFLQWDWSSALSSAPIKYEGTLKVFVPLESATAERCGATLIHTLELLLAGRSDIELTIGLVKNGNRAVVDAVNHLAKARPQRVRIVKRRNWYEWAGLYPQHHFTFIPSIRCNSGYLAADSLACRVPVLAFDVSPLSDQVHNGNNGVLLSCNVVESELKCPSAVFNPRQLLTELEANITPGKYLLLIRNDWNEPSKRKLFDLQWSDYWFKN